MDTRTQEEKQSIGERRSGIERRSTSELPSKEQLALFARRMRRALRDEKSRGFFGVANGEQDFAIYPDVIHIVGWIEGLAAVQREQQVQVKPSLRRAVPGAAVAQPELVAAAVDG
jgi:hypothetical protein